MTREMNAILMIAEHPEMTTVMMPAIDIKKEEVYWDLVDHSGLSGGQRAALSWASCLWLSHQTGLYSGLRDPFEGFGAMSRSLRVCVVNALAQFV